MRYRYDGISPWKQRAFEFSRIWFIESIIMTSGKCLLQNQCFVLIRLPLCINLGCFQKPPDSAKVFYERLSSFVFFLWGFIKRQTWIKLYFYIFAVTTLDFCQTRGLDRAWTKYWCRWCRDWCSSNVVRAQKKSAKSNSRLKIFYLVKLRITTPWQTPTLHRKSISV